MNATATGTRADHRARRRLEAAGVTVVRAAGSKGPADLVAFDPTSIRLISVKSGTTSATAIEREAWQRLMRPSNASVASWRCPDRARAPIIERR